LGTTPVNVALAESDRTALNQRYARIFPGCPPERAAWLEALVQSGGRVSINSFAPALVHFLRQGRYLNIHQLVNNGRPADVNYGTRVIVEQGIGYETIGASIVYGNLNVGNCGIDEFGDYCIILRRESIESRTSFVQDNTFRYFRRDLLGGPATGGISPGHRATWSDVGRLAVVKLEEHLRNMKGYDRQALQSLVAHGSEFIEAHVYGPVRRRDVEEIRVTAELMSQMEYYARRARLNDSEQLSFDTHAAVIGLLDRHGIPLRVSR
jgi:hypothetical protein